MSTSRINYENWVVDASGDVIGGADVEVRRLYDNTLVSASALFTAETGSAAKATNPFAAEADGSFSLWLAPGGYTFTLGSGASQAVQSVYLVPADVAFTTRALLVTAVAAGASWPDGTLISDGTVTYKAQSGATAIADLPGLVLFGNVEVDDAAALLASTYTGFTEGQIIRTRAEGFAYEVAAADAVDHDETTAGGVKLYNLDNGMRAGTVEWNSGRVNGYMVLQNIDAAGQARLYVEPRTGATGDVVAAIKVFADDYTEGEHNRYRDVGLFIDKTEGSYPNIGAALLNAKNGEEFWGLFMEMGLSVSDGGAIPLRAGRINHRAAGSYFDAKLWIPGQAVTSGEYVLVGTDASGVVQGHVYQATTTGNMGSTKPTHTSGSGTDGTISYDFIEDLSATSSGYTGYVLLGDKADRPIRGAHILDNDIVAQFSQPAVFPNQVELFFAGASDTSVTAKTYTDASGDYVAEILTTGKSVFLQAFDGAMLRVTNSLVETSGAALKLANTTQTGLTTLDFTNASIAVVNNLSALTITAVSGRGDQPVWIRNGNNTNTTIQNNASIVTGTGGDYVIPAGAVVHGLMTTAGKLVLIGL